MGDTLLCTTISGVHDRYQARVVWLVVMAALICIFRTTLNGPQKPLNDH
jgi:hypothetical protein